MAKKIKITKPSLAINGTVARLSARIAFPEGTQSLYFECSAEHADKLSVDTCDGFMVAILPVAMRRGLDVVVEGLYLLNSIITLQKITLSYCRM